MLSNCQRQRVGSFFIILLALLGPLLISVGVLRHPEIVDSAETVAVAPAAGQGCSSLSHQDIKNIEKDALTVADIACVFGSALVDPEALALACGIEKRFVPILDQLIGQREAAKRAGVKWTPRDAGASDAAKE